MIAALYSGGKDSTLAVHRMHKEGKDVELLISIVPQNDFSYMFHKPNIRLTALQAEAMGIRHVLFDTPGEKEEELGDLEAALKLNRVTEIVTGAVASTYQKNRIDEICRRLGVVHHAPLWGVDPVKELGELAKNFEVIITQVSAEGFDDSMLGQRLDEEMIRMLIKLHERYRVNLLFEGGEAESFVLDAPLFKKKVVIKSAHKERMGSAGRYVIDEAVLEDKQRQKGY